ncbi:DUF3017 domain-containing protein [Streptomyces tauricus]|uniref:DUF3017 domain-containing protein n=1 Tax=Streptomyces tauricus TaxID=68274 RepID=A0ABZ1JID9_9ACTN|nr:DUF3017 domain-containing protein [Streptomyces tauricus]
MTSAESEDRGAGDAPTPAAPENGAPDRQDAAQRTTTPDSASGPAPASGKAPVPGPAPASGAASGPAQDSEQGSASASGSEAASSESSESSERDEELTVRDAVSAPGPDGEPRRVTRRFPLFTRDTARPEGGGRAAPRDAPAPARQWPILAVTGLVGLGLLLTALDAFKAGTLLIGVALLVGAAMRWVLPDVGMLAVRSRFTDLVTYGVLGAAIALLAMMAQPNPWLELPFLDDTLHFTIRT